MKYTKLAPVLSALTLLLGCARQDAPVASANHPIERSTELRPASRVTPEERAPRTRLAGSETAAQSAEDSEELRNGANEDTKQDRTPDVVFVPTPQPVVDKMLELAKPKKTDIVYDLGCGDGRIVVTAAKRYGTKAFGFDIDPVRVQEARANVLKNNVEDLVTIEEKDIFTLDLSRADIVTLYLLPELNVRLIPQLQKLKRGARVVSHDFDMQGVTPAQNVFVNVASSGRDHAIYLWYAPIRKDKETTSIPE